MSPERSYAKEVFETESQALSRLSALLTADFDHAVAAIVACKGRVVVSGMGKSGHIGRKIAATLSSTGTPAFFMHPAEALHGDLGMVGPGDVLLSISYSGETDELMRMVPYLRSRNICHICISGNPAAALPRHADWRLNVQVEKEACPLQLAPTASTTATLAMGDALAIAAMRIRGFEPQDFAAFHPGGSLGRRLLTTVAQLMRSENLPVVAASASTTELIHTLSKGRLGLVVVVENGLIAGIITDGDVRRGMERLEQQFFGQQAAALMTPNPVTVSPGARLVEAEALCHEKKIASLLVADAGRLLGIIQIYDMHP